jgi:hypothetical protein
MFSVYKLLLTTLETSYVHDSKCVFATAFIDYKEQRDADDAIRELNYTKFDGQRFPFFFNTLFIIKN